MKPALGQHISFAYKGKALEGVILNKEKGKLVVKLDSGYNISVAPDEMKNIKELKVEAKMKVPRLPKKPKDGLPKVALLHTGGTIASRVDYETGAVIAQYTAEEVLGLYPELLDIADIKSELVSNMQSEMMRFAHWNMLAKAVEQAVKDGAKGVIVTHGTDILHMTAAALSFALKDITVPVLVVGSQRSSDRPSSDAVTNLLCATTFIAKEKFTGVALCMHEGIEKDDCVILPACRSRKMHTSRRDAFKPINDTPYACITYPKLKVERLRNYPKVPDSKLEVKLFNEKLKIGLLHIHPQMYAEEFLAYAKFDGLVLELLGIGHVPTMATDAHNKEHTKILDAITSLAKKLPIVASPQTIYGRVNMNVYSPGRQLLEAGVLGQGLDLTPETAFVKLAWLLSNHDKKEVRQLYSENLRGELVARSDEEGFSSE
ncbi:Glu-tRNA(Gln) amidotransferase subunit GatD [Candidatus Woesearchaeota archaeon]|nr:Glu-tRNA(Gln) amidotransferase subunit GatD [Candidatus Woesearchaeota archaeon]